MLAKDINPQRLRTFSLIGMDRVYKQKAIFFCSLLQACVNSHNYIINDSNLDQADKNLYLYNIMINPLELEKQILPKQNRVFIYVVSLTLLCYAQNERSNLFQRVIGHYAFFSNIPKHFVESLYQIGIIISYKSI